MTASVLVWQKQFLRDFLRFLTVAHIRSYHSQRWCRKNAPLETSSPTFIKSSIAGFSSYVGIGQYFFPWIPDESVGCHSGPRYRKTPVLKFELMGSLELLPFCETLGRVCARSCGSLTKNSGRWNPLHHLNRFFCSLSLSLNVWLNLGIQMLWVISAIIEFDKLVQLSVNAYFTRLERSVFTLFSRGKWVLTKMLHLGEFPFLQVIFPPSFRFSPTYQLEYWD